MKHFPCLFLLLTALGCFSAESPYLYGIHDHDPNPSEFLAQITNATGAGAWITATVAVGANTNDFSGVNFNAFANTGHTVICRINYGYFPEGTIPVVAQYDAFALRIKNFVANSAGCTIWLIGNELNLSAEWPFDGARFNYVSPQDYAACFRKAYNAIKSIRPNDKVIPQASAPWGGPYGPGAFNVNGMNYPADGQPLTWVQYQRQTLVAITNSGPLDGIALHIGSRGYHYADIHSTNKFAGLNLYSSFYVYKDWIDYGIPPELYHLPLYVTECNGLYYWKGGGPPGEDPTQHYEPGWMQEIYAEINRYNQIAATTGKPIFRCFNLYRWCAFCDGWNIDGASNPYKTQILSDLALAAAQKYSWPAYVSSTNAPPAPTNLLATVGNGNIQLSWSDAPFASGYHVKRSIVNGGPYAVIASNLTTTSYLNTSFIPGTTYYYRVSAFNAYGESTDSAQASATPTNGLPDVVVTAVSWTPLGILFAPTNVVFRATVINQGSAPTPNGITLGVGFLVDGGQVSWSGGHSASLLPGNSLLLSADGGPFGINYWTATPGTHTVTANVDDINRFAEGNEVNNISERSVAIYVRSYAVNCGGASAGPFAADAYWTGSTNTYSVGNSIDTSAVSNPAPQAVYQSERWGQCAYLFSHLVPSTNYTIRLHFAEISPSVVNIGDRRFHVAINQTQVLTNFDILATAGIKFRALTRQFTAFPNPLGQLALQFSQGAANEAKISGIEIFPTPSLPPPSLLPVKITNGVVTLSWQAYAGKSYRLQYKNELSASAWTDLTPDVLATDSTASKTDLPGTARRFYRVLQVN